jgi:hypothetical protein
MVLEVKSLLAERLVLLFISPLCMFATALSFFLLYEALKMPHPAVLAISFIFIGLLTSASCLMLFVLLQSLFVRRFVFDFNTHTCLFENVPGFSTTIPFSRIEAVDILVIGERGCCLGIKIETKRRRLRVLCLSGHRGSTVFSRIDPTDVVTARLRPLAETLSTLLDKPIRVFEEATV